MLETSGWTLANIRTKVRNVTGSPAVEQITDAELNAYINNYYVYTMPFELKEQIANQFLQFKTTPGLDVYAFPGGYFTDSPGAYADGFPLIFYQDPDVFFQDWPQQFAVNNIATGDGTTSSFSGGLQNPPIIIGTTFITADDPSGNQQLVQDQGDNVTQTIATGSGVTNYTGTLGVFPIVPGSMTVTDGIENFVDNGAGFLTGSQGGTGTINYTTGVFSVTFNTAVATGVSIISNYISDSDLGALTGDGVGTINYLTGAYTVTFNKPPAQTAVIYAKYQGYSANRPQGVLFFNNEFTFRPVPDQAYQILMQGFIKPLLLVNDSDTPLQNEWGALIAYGASIEIFSDRGDEESYQSYFPIFKRYENVALGRTIQQYTAEQSVPRF
jgi:hypothetical protein